MTMMMKLQSDEVEVSAPVEDEVEALAQVEDEVEALAPVEDNIEALARPTRGTCSRGGLGANCFCISFSTSC